MVGFGLAGHFREVVVTQRKFSREREIGGNVLFAVLQLHCVCRPLQPCRVIVRWVASDGRVLRRRKVCTVYTGDGTKVIVEAVVLLNDDHDTFDWIVRLHGFFKTSIDSNDDH